ncbi:MAG: glycosyltransferase family 2 protein [Ignisphaera sp.]
MKIGFAILNYNNYQDTIDCVNSLLSCLYQKENQGIAQVKILIIDNCSSNNSINQIQSFIKTLNLNSDISLHLLKLDRNYGYAGGNNLGLKYLFEKNNCDVVFVVNNDLLFHKVSLRELMENIRINNECLFGALLYDRCKGAYIYGGAIFNEIYFHSRNVYLPSKISTLNKREMFYLTGAFLGFTKAIYQSLGGFLEDYFLYFEELEYFYRYKKIFKKFPEVKVLESWVVIHKIGGSTGQSINLSKKSLLSEYYSARARILFAKDCLPFFLPSAIIYNIFLMAHRLIRGFYKNFFTIMLATVNGLLDERGIKLKYH